MSTDLDRPVPAPLTMEVAGYTVTVTYERSYYGTLVPIFSFPPELIRHLDEVFDIELEEDTWKYSGRYVIVDPDGIEIVSTEYRWDIEAAYRRELSRLARAETLPEFKAELEELRQEAERLRERGLYWAELAQAIWICEHELQFRADHIDVARVKENLGRIRKFIARMTGPFIEVAV